MLQKNKLNFFLILTLTIITPITLHSMDNAPDDATQNAHNYDNGIKAEEYKQAQEATKKAQQDNSTIHQVLHTVSTNFSVGAGTGFGQSVGGSIVAAAQHELDFLYSEYRPTQLTHLQEIEYASKIITAGIANVSENYERQLKLIQTTQDISPGI